MTREEAFQDYFGSGKFYLGNFNTDKQHVLCDFNCDGCYFLENLGTCPIGSHLRIETIKEATEFMPEVFL